MDRPFCGRTAWLCGGIAAIALLLCMQPDASQLLAFALPMLVVLIGADIRGAWKWSASTLLALLTLLCRLRPDTLAPVSCTEGILEILKGQSELLYIAGILALLLLPTGLMTRGFREKRRTWIGVGLYYMLMILSKFFGSFPVPFMGYGASPIPGCFIMILSIQEQ